MGLIGAALGLAGCWGDNYTWYQKITVFVNTPSGVRSGSAITKIEVNINNGGSPRLPKTFGEAAVVEVAPGQYLFALLAPPAMMPELSYLAEKVWQDELPEIQMVMRDGQQLDSRKTYRQLYEAVQRLRGVRDVPRQYWPFFVTFKDVKDPRSVIEVNPNGLSSSFGTGYSLRAITIEMIGASSIKTKIENVLPWLRTDPPDPLAGSRSMLSEPPLSELLGVTHFLKEE